MNKPVAWMALNELNGSYSTFTNDQKQRLLPHVSQCYGKWIPLYTHPVKENCCPDCGCHFTGEYPFNYTVKELTDEEIYRLLADSIWAVGLNTDCLDEQNWADGITVARAILRKAQEK